MFAFNKMFKHPEHGFYGLEEEHLTNPCHVDE